MNLRQIVDTKVADIYAGGPGSGCNPDVGKCGRPEGSVNITSGSDGVLRSKFMKTMSDWYDVYEKEWNDADIQDPKSEWLKLGKDMTDWAERMALSIYNDTYHRQMFIVERGNESVLAGIYHYNDRRLYVSVLVANPKYLGKDKGAIKETIGFLKKQARDKGIKFIEFERAGKGRDDSVSGGRIFKASIQKGKYA